MGYNVIITGASGMVGKGVLLECLDSPQIAAVTVINRKPQDITHPKLTELVLPDFTDSHTLELSGFDACYFCLGVSALGLNEKQYTAITYDLALDFAKHFIKNNQQALFCYVSGAGTNAKSRTMWARVKGQTEEDLKSMPFKKVYCFRPGFIQPLRGIQSKTGWYNAIYTVLRPIAKPLKGVFNNAITDTTALGKAMINILDYGWSHHTLDNRAINQLADKES